MLNGRDATADVADTDVADVIRKTARIDAPPARVFGLLTEQEQIELWFAHVATIEGRVGGAVEFVFLNRNGTLGVFRGHVTALEAGRKVAFTWHNDSWEFPPLEIEFSVEPAAGGSRLRLTQRGFAGQPVERDIHDTGWDQYLRRLAAVADGSRPEGWNLDP
jgi:uncharacterized protein YndB with AHSA1/START domain